MKILGLDIGSRAVKLVYMEDLKIVKKQSISTISFYRNFCKFSGKLVADLEELGVGDADIKVSTGYGRNNTNIQQFNPINEIKAHVYGALYQTNLLDFILLDVGGQDVKIVRVEKGIITDLELNEKCAASCGRYIENMATVLEISIEELCSHYIQPIELNSTCAVFSESELIGRIAEGIETSRLCAGVNFSMYKRLQPMLTKFKGRKLVLAGGVANNKAIQKYLQNDYNEVIILKEAQYNGAIGCCYYGERIKSK